MGYILRLTEANGYPTTSYILSSLHGHWYRSSVGRLDASPLAEISDLSPEEIARITMLPQGKPRAFVRIYGNDLPAYEAPVGSPKICPLCLGAGSGCEAFWDLSQAVACPLHKVMLIRSCERCGKKLSWCRSKTVECRCGANLSTQQCTPAASELCALMGVMRYLVYQDPSIAPLPSEMEHLAHLDLRRLCKLLWVMSGERYRCEGDISARKRHLPKSRARYLPQLITVADALSDWPHGFHKFLSSNYEGPLTTTAELPSFNVTFAWLLTRLIKNDPDGLNCFGFLERELYQFGAKFWTRDAMSRRGDPGLLPLQMRWGTIGQGAKILGLHMATMKKAVDAGEIKIRIISKTKKTRSVLIDLEWARQQLRSSHSSIQFRAAAKALGVSHQTLRALRQAGTYQVTYRPRVPGCLAKEDVDSLIGRLRALADGKGDAQGADVISLGRLIFGSDLSPKEKATFLAELLENPKLVIGYEGKEGWTGPARCQMHVDAAKRLVRRVRTEKKCLTGQQTAKKLRCVPAVITALKRSGRLATRQWRGRTVFTIESVDEFAKRYEPLACIARRANVSISRINGRVDLSVLRQFNVRTTAHTTTFIDRRDVSMAEKLFAAA